MTVWFEFDPALFTPCSATVTVILMLYSYLVDCTLYILYSQQVSSHNDNKNNTLEILYFSFLGRSCVLRFVHKNTDDDLSNIA